MESMEIDENNSSGNSTPYLNGSPCYSSEDELPSLGQFLSTTPKKQEIKETEDDLNDTPPLSNSISFSTSFSTPPRLAVPQVSTMNLSPIANVQPCTNVIISNEKENMLSDDLLKKSLTRVASSRESQRRQDKIQELKHSGGVLAMSRRTHQKINQVKEEIDNLRANNPQVKKDLEHSVVELPITPGVKYFTRPPHFHAGFVKCSETGNPLIDKITSESSNFTNINQFMFVLNGKPCPTLVILWLMDNACLSSDVITRHTSLLTLAQLASICTSLTSPIDIGDFHMLISKLGAIVQPARAGDSQHQSNDIITTEMNGCSNPRANDHQTPELLQNSIANFCKAVLIVFQHFHSIHSTPVLIKGLAIILLDIALDPVVCSNFVCEDVSLCLQTVLLSAAELDWGNIQSDIVSHCTHQILSDHQNQYHIVTLLSSPSTRIRLLQYTLVRLYLTGACLPEGGDAPQLQDIVLASKVINHYYEQQDLNFKELHSMMKMLSVLLLSSKMQWNSTQPDLGKKDIVNMLSKLTGSIKDNLPGVILERGPIKDFIISLNLELQQTGKFGRKEMTQTSMSDYILDKD